MLAQGQDVAEHTDFHALGTLTEGRCDEVGGWHRAVSTVVMFVKHHAVKA